MKKPELLIPAGSIEEMLRYIEAGADAVEIGESGFAMRLPGEVRRGDFREAVRQAHGRGAKVYVVANHLIENEALEDLNEYVQAAGEAGADALVFGDPAVPMALDETGVRLPLHWNPEMTATNYESAAYWAKHGAIRAVLARELNMEQVLEFKRKSRLAVQVLVHGATNIYHSKRSLLSNYFEHLGKKASAAELGLDRGLFLIEEERQDERFPAYQDRTGTHIISSEDVCMLENVQELAEGGVDSFKIESLLKSVDYNVTALRSYRLAIDAYATGPDGYGFKQEWLDAIERLQPPERPLAFGFYYKEQVY